MQTEILDLDLFNSFIKSNQMALVYFSTPTCSVCKVLRPKLIEFIQTDFPMVEFGYVDCEENKITAAQNSVFTVPTIIFFFSGKEVFRKSRNFSLTEIEDQISRYAKF